MEIRIPLYPFSPFLWIKNTLISYGNFRFIVGGVMTKRILIAAGGTGGHVYPAIALAEKLREMHPEIYLHFAGGKLSSNPFFAHKNFDFTEVKCGSLGGKGFSLVKEAARISQGIIESLRLLKSYRPELIIGFGSYHTFPILAAARLARIPYVLQEANALPGKVVKFFSSKAVFTGLNFPLASQYLKGKTLEIPLPVRKGYKKGSHTHEAACRAFGLDPQRLTCLVFGGSQGAQALNSFVLEMLPLFKNDTIQFLHVTGDKAMTDELQRHYVKHNVLAYVTSFESRMDLAWSAAGFALTRAGASTIAEAIEFEVPALLVPYPYAADQHQDVNADFFVDTVKAGLKFQQDHLNPNALYAQIATLRQNPQQLLLWSENMKKYKLQAKPRTLDQEIVSFLQKGNV